MRSLLWVSVCVALSILVPVAWAAPPASAVKMFTVTVTCKDAEAVVGAGLKVLKYHPETRGMRPVNGLDAVFDAEGQCGVDLVPGKYVFEVLSDHLPGTLVALRTKPLALNRGRTIEIESNEAVPLVVLAEGEPIAPGIVTIRSAGTEGALTWIAKDGAVPSIILSTNHRYKIGILGSRDTQRYAFWLTVRPEDMDPITLPMDKALEASFVWRPDNGARDESAPVYLAMFYPDTTWRIEVVPETRLSTNRRYVEVAYSYQIPRGERMYFHRVGYLIGKSTQVELGGPITAHAYVAVHRTYAGKGYTSRLATEVWLADPGGHQLNPVESKAKLTKELVRNDGRPLPPTPLTPGSLDSLRPLANHFRLEVSYDIGQPIQLTLKPLEPVEMKSAHFVMQAVPGWEWRNKMYLLRAERAYDLLRPISATPASSRVTVGWLTNNHRARGGWKGKRRGNKRGFINMPMLRYRQCFDAFAHTNFLVHEVAHTYGYSHGEVMNAVVREGERRYRAHRWFAADNPNYVPGRSW